MKSIHVSTFLLALLAASPLVRAQDEGSSPLRDRLASDGRNAWLAKACASIAQDASQHVVSLSTTRGSHRGYGVVLEDGLVLTCDAILKGETELTATGTSGSWTATVLGRNQANDVALLKLRGGSPSPIAKGSSKGLSVGQWVITAGTTGTPLAVGVVSAKDRPVEPAGNQMNILVKMFSDGNNGPQRSRPSVVQHDGPLAPEHFGAPLLDAQGRLVGINVAAPYRGSSHAVGIDTILPLLGQLTANPPAGRPWLGCKAAEVFEGLPRGYRCGLEVREIQAQSPAQTAGLVDGDVILAIDGQRFTSIDAFGKTILSHQPGDTVTFTVLRGPTERKIAVTLGAN